VTRRRRLIKGAAFGPPFAFEKGGPQLRWGGALGGCAKSEASCSFGEEHVHRTEMRMTHMLKPYQRFTTFHSNRGRSGRGRTRSSRWTSPTCGRTGFFRGSRRDCRPPREVVTSVGCFLYAQRWNVPLRTAIVAWLELSDI